MLFWGSWRSVPQCLPVMHPIEVPPPPLIYSVMLMIFILRRTFKTVINRTKGVAIEEAIVGYCFP